MTASKIICGVDFSSKSKAAVTEALNVAEHMGAELILAHIAEPLAPIHSKLRAEWEQVTYHRDEAVRQQLAEMQTQLKSMSRNLSYLLVEGEPKERLASLATECGATLLVVGTHGRTGVKHFLLGSVAEQTIRRSETNVLVVRPGGSSKGGFGKILVPTDFSPHAEAALVEALAVAACNAEIELVHFWQLPTYACGEFPPNLTELSAERRRDAEALGNALLAKYQTQHRQLHFEVAQAAAAHGIIDRVTAANQRYDAIVMGSHGFRGFRRFFLGSVAEKVVRHAPCSVLMVHHCDASATCPSV